MRIYLMRRIEFMMLLVFLLLGLGIYGGVWWARAHSATEAKSMNQKTASVIPQQQKALYWYDPMVPQQHFDKPGKSPFMDMELVPQYASAHTDSASVVIDPSITQNLGLRLALVKKIPNNRVIDVSGIVHFNEHLIAVVQARGAGFVERAMPLAMGDLVKQGQPLAEVVIPEWNSAQQEFLAVQATGDAALLKIARERLYLLGMSKTTISALEKTRQAQTQFTIVAPVSGMIQSFDVRPGMTVMTGQTLARMNGLSSVWLETSVPEAQASTIESNAAAAAHFSAWPGKIFPGKVTHILPALNENTRSVQVRIELLNTNNQLKPGLSAQVKLTSAVTKMALVVPTESVIRTGQRSLLMIAEDQGHFRPVEVTAGNEVGDQTIIVSGVTEGQEVVASGQFLIDSEASLKGITMKRGAE